MKLIAYNTLSATAQVDTSRLCWDNRGSMRVHSNGVGCIRRGILDVEANYKVNK